MTSRGAADRLDFQISTDATSLTTGTWTDVNTLDLNSPNISAATNTLDGNATANRADISAVVSGLSIPNGATFFIRWTDFDISSSDDGLGVDDFSLTPNPTVSTNPSGTGAANPGGVLPGESSLLTVTVTPGTNPPSTGLAVTADLAAIGGAATQTFFDDGTNGDVTATDNVFSFEATVDNATTAGSKSLPASITDAQSRTGSASIPLTVLPPLVTIHEIQGAGTMSPFLGQAVTTTGIVTGLKVGSSGGFFVQMPDAEVDADPNTSEGLFVFTGSTLPSGAAIGNDVRVSGTVVEFVPGADPFSPPLTELTGPFVSVRSAGNPLPGSVIITAADTNPAGSLEQLERYEGMRVCVESLTAISPTQGTITESSATSTSNGVFYGVITGLARPFREPGILASNPLPAGAPCCVPRFDENPERLRVDSDGQPGAPALNVTTGTVVSNLVGPLDFGFRTYTILPDAATPPSVGANASAAAVPVPGLDQFTIASFNVERFFDTANDPAIGEPVLTATAFENRLNKLSLAIRNVMRLPDIIGFEEVENLSTLQTIADRINSDAIAAAQPNPSYAAYLQEGNDIGGIDVGFLVKTARVAVIDVTQEGKDATYVNPQNGLNELLNDRPPLVLRAAIDRPFGGTFPITVIANHLRSLSGVEDPVDGERVRAKRRAQAEFLANLIQARQAANPGERIISLGDYNAFQFNDGLVDSIGTVKGMPTPADEVVLPSDDLVNPNLANLVDLAPAIQRYSFVFDGNAQSLDHALITANLMPQFTLLAYGRVGADFPESYRNDANRPERISDHDPLVAYFTFEAPGLTARPWIGLANSDDVGIRFDVMAEVHKTDAPSNPISVGLAESVRGGSSGFNNAVLHSVAMSAPNDLLSSGDAITVKLFVRNACTGSGKNSGRARLWFNDAAANSRLEIDVAGQTTNLYLVDPSMLSTTTGPGPKKTVTVAAGAKCSPFKPLGAWTGTLP